MLNNVKENIKKISYLIVNNFKNSMEIYSFFIEMGLEGNIKDYSLYHKLDRENDLYNLVFKLLKLLISNNKHNIIFNICSYFGYNGNCYTKNCSYCKLKKV